MEHAARPLGMRRPSDDRHRRLYALAAVPPPAEPTPVVLGTNWYCIAPGQRVLTTDLRWVPVERVQPGDVLIGFDECLGRSARYRPTIVEANPVVVRPMVEVVTSAGTVAVSRDHRFVRRHPKRAHEWVQADELMPGDELLLMMRPYEEDRSWEAGWLAGFFDGEGTLAGHEASGVFRLDLSQKVGPELEMVYGLLAEKGYQARAVQKRRGRERWQDLDVLTIQGGYDGALRFLGHIRPARLLRRAALLWQGRAITSRSSGFATVHSVRPIGTHEVYAVGTSTRTLLVEGLLSHNTSFDTPERLGRHWWIGLGADWGRVRGGHAWCLKPDGLLDRLAWWRAYDQGVEGACFPAGTLIQMADGTWQAIEAVRLLDDVRTAEGNVAKVHQTMVRWHDAGLIRVRLRGHVGLRMTPEHPVLTQRGYVAAGELTLGDRVALTRSVYEESVGRIDVARYLPAAVSRRATNGTRRYHDRHGGTTVVSVTPVPDTIPLTEAFGRLIGLYLAEGHTTDQKVVWSFGGHERGTLAPETVALVREALGAEAHLQVRANNVVNVVLYGKRWRAFFETLCGTGSEAKQVPAELASATPDIRRALLDGWLAGDGHRRRTEIMGVTISARLALGMYGIATDLGLCPTLVRTPPSANRHAATRQERWEVHLPEGDGRRPSMDDRAVWRRVSAIEHEPWSGFVYNLAVAGDNSYVAEGIGVHNCVGFALSRMMSLLNRELYDAFWLYRLARRLDEWPGEAYEGTSVRAGCDVLRAYGHLRRRGGQPDPACGVVANRWAQHATEIQTCLRSPRQERGGYVVILNSWGRLRADGAAGWPHYVRLPLEALDRLPREDGEATLVTDR